MSIALMSALWDRDCGSDLLLLLALADHGDDDGRDIRPSLDRLAWKVQMSRSTVKRRVKALRERGVLVIQAEATRHRPTEYRLVVGQLPQKAPFDQGGQIDPPDDLGGSNGTIEGGHSYDPRNVKGNVNNPPTPLKGGTDSDQPSLDPAVEARVEAFLDVHAARVEARGAAKPPRTAPAREAARTILRREPDSREILARLDWALGHPYWSDKVLTLPSFRRYWDRLTVQWKAAVARDAALGNGHNRPQEPTFRRVDYSGERVRIIRDDD